MKLVYPENLSKAKTCLNQIDFTVRTNVTDMTGKDFMDPTKDKTIRAHPVEEEK
jgi:hypothetical protein